MVVSNAFHGYGNCSSKAGQCLHLRIHPSLPAQFSGVGFVGKVGSDGKRGLIFLGQRKNTTPIVYKTLYSVQDSKF